MSGCAEMGRLCTNRLGWVSENTDPCLWNLIWEVFLGGLCAVMDSVGMSTCKEVLQSFFAVNVDVYCVNLLYE